MGQTRNDDVVDVTNHVRERFGRLRRMFGKVTPDIARLDIGRNRQALDVLEVVGDEVDKIVSVCTELVGIHGLHGRSMSCVRSSGS